MTCILRQRRARDFWFANSRAKRGNGLAILAQACTLAFALAVFVAPIAAQDFRTTEQLRARFTHETDPAHKAKLLQPLGDSEFKDAQAALAEDKIPAALEIVKTYLGEAQTC